jgi:histidine triad (HIT) family protein
MVECIFCRIARKDAPANIVYEDSDNMAFLDVVPVDVGHTLVITKKHYNDFLEAPNKDIAKTIDIIDKVAVAIMKALNASSFKVVINNGKDAGQIIDHFHVHVIPYFREGKNFYRKRDVDSEELKSTAEKIRKVLK